MFKLRLPYFFTNFFSIHFTLLVCALVSVPHMEVAAKGSDSLILYSGRSEELIGPLIKEFNELKNFQIKVRYGKTAEMAALLLEEGKHSPADLFFAQDAGALGALAKANRLSPLPQPILGLVENRFRSEKGLWIGISGRARVIVYNSAKLKKEDLPREIFDFCNPEWKNRIGWAPTNGSFQGFITALRILEGEEKARQWLTCIKDNGAKSYPKNTPIVAAVGSGEIDIGFVNHYYLHRFLQDFGEGFQARNYYLPSGSPGNLVNVAGVGLLVSSKRKQQSLEFVKFLLSPSSQEYFTNKTYEYPLLENIETNPQLAPLKNIKTPVLDLSNLEDLKGTLELLQKTGAL